MEHKQPAPSIEAAHAGHLRSLPFGDTAGLRRCRSRVPRRARARGRARRPTAVSCGTTTATTSSRATRPTTVHPSLWRQSQLVAQAGTLRGRRGHLPGARTRPLEHHLRRGRHRRHRHRPAHLDRDRGGRARAVPRAPRRPAGRRGHLHPQPRRPLRRRLRRRPPRPTSTRAGAGDRPRGLRRARGRGERLRRHGDVPPGRLHVRRGARARPAGPGRRRARPDHVVRRGRRSSCRPSRSRTTGETHTIDGVEIEFQMAPGTEAPAEMHFYFPRYRALCMAENATHTLHNLLTLRGAVVRDPHVWSKYLTEAIERVRRPGRRRLRLAPLADVGPRSHRRVPRRRSATSTPTCTTRPCGCSTRATPAPRSPRLIELPPALEKAWNTHGYYGSVSHNVKAIYQRYMGWFDGNPARLWPHPPADARDALRRRDRRHRPRRRARAGGVRRRRLPLGGDAARPRRVRRRDARRCAGALRRHARAARLRRGERHVAQLLPLRCDRAARRATSAPRPPTSAPAIVAQLTPEQLFDAIAISVDGPKAWDLDDRARRDLHRPRRATSG